MSSAPLISVVMPLYNGEAYLPGSIGSILRQNRADLELIVVDDGSTDRGAEVVRRLAPEARCIRQENRGCPAARNAGLAQVRGQWVAFLDADDEWPDGSLAVRAAALAAHPDALFVQGRTNFLVPAGVAPVEPWVATNLGAGLFRRELFDRAGRFDESRGLTEDVEWFMRVRELGVGYVTLPDVTLHYRVGTGGITHNRSWRDPELKQALRASLARRRQAAAGGQAQELNWLSGSKQDPRATGEVNHGS